MSDVVVALVCLEVNTRWFVDIQIGCVVCIFDVIVVLILDVIPVADVDCVTDVIGGCVGHGLVIFSVDDAEFDVSVSLEVGSSKVRCQRSE